jgi:hypothetical protein
MRLHELVRSDITPQPIYDKSKCPRCSLLSYCMPKKMGKAPSVMDYLARTLREEQEQ